ncbi:MAG TPA: SpoIID/LytB domain-containing protein [Mycobacteriales bacterium]|nr:SpoIID/LytB domain-containing protein [Mycobacteriales bacterium]
MRYTGEFRRRRLPAPVLAGTCAVALLAGAVATGIAGRPPAAAAGAEVVTRPASGVWVAEGGGFGHGRGMSQWGARAAALRGRTAEQIVAFYYPRTVRKAVGNPTVRVRVGTDPELVVSPSPGLRVSWRGGRLVLPARAQVRRWKVGAYAAGLRLAYHAGHGWRWWGPRLPAAVTVVSSRPVRRVHWRDRTATDYRGTLAVSRSGRRVLVVDRLPMESYLAGVVPRESPASWPMQALRAQAIAARTYAYAAVRSPRSARYDLCDSTACQVYGGAARLRPDGTRLFGERRRTTAAVASTAGVVLLSGRRPATTEYSASNGGWSAPGGRPYLVGRRDPYRAGDPYLSWRVRVSVADLGRKFGFSRLDRLRVLRRDGHGAWGGRLLEVELTGLDGAGKPRAVTVGGGRLRRALGLRSTYFRLRAG